MCNNKLAHSGSLLKLISLELMILSNHLILCHPLLLLHSIFPSIRVFSRESVLHIRWVKYQSFSFSISPSNEYSRQISFRIDWFDILAISSKGLSRVFSNNTVQKHQFFGAQQFIGHGNELGFFSGCIEKPLKRFVLKCMSHILIYIDSNFCFCSNNQLERSNKEARRLVKMQLIQTHMQ